MGVQNPLGATALVAVAVLLALYLYDRRQRVVRVATVFLWQRVPTQPLARRRLRPDALFLLQLALLLALIGGLLRPYVRGASPSATGAPLVLVLDLSASMQTRERGGTRFDLARGRAHAALDALGATDPILLLTAAERPRVAVRWTTDHAGARERLDTLTPRDTGTNLPVALAVACAEAAAHTGARVAVLTDLAPEASGLGPRELAGVEWAQIGHRDDNLALAALVVEAPPFAGTGAPSAQVTVRNYGRQQRWIALEARVGGRLWAQRDLTMAPRTSQHVLLEDPPGGGLLDVRLIADDALALDNRAYGWVATGEPLDLLAVTDSRELARAVEELGRAVAGSRVAVVAPALYTPSSGPAHRVVVFDGLVPDHRPVRPSLYVAPPRDNPICPSAGVLEHAAVIDWDPDHPLVAGLDGLQAIAVAQANDLRGATWGTPIVTAVAEQHTFPFLVAGERDGHRQACLGADLAGSLTAADRLPLLLLTLATVRWLGAPTAQVPLEVATGVAALAGPGPTAPVRGPHGEAGLVVGGEPAVLVAERTGVYRVGPEDAPRLVLANLFDDRESDVGRSGARDWRATEPPAPAARRPTHEVGWWLYLLAAGLCGAEWLAWRRRA